MTAASQIKSIGIKKVRNEKTGEATPPCGKFDDKTGMKKAIDQTSVSPSAI
ncbi:MAG: hypothetical protein AAF198_05420 [Pseudomonadota bacterium]